MTTILFRGHVHEFDPIMRSWCSHDDDAVPDSYVLTDAMDPRGPGPEQANPADWAIAQVRNVWPEIKVLTRDEE